tara:strand:+ start:2564 stop:3037 length:474 start_codon:yes stop_codon:yes gene_type:complete
MKILLIGSCGVGKTWVMKNLLATTQTRPGKIGKFKFHYNKDIVVVGVYDGSTFEGSDRLSMSVITDLGKFLSWCGNRCVICEGDRFTNSTYITQAHPVIFKIQGDGSAGREIRGSKQTERHLKSIATRVGNIKEDVLASDSAEALELILKLISNDRK